MLVYNTLQTMLKPTHSSQFAVLRRSELQLLLDVYTLELSLKHSRAKKIALRRSVYKAAMFTNTAEYY